MRDREFHNNMVNAQGALISVNKAIQELQELQETLRDWKSLYFNGAVDGIVLKKSIEDIQEERVDVAVMLERLDSVFNFKGFDNDLIRSHKIERTKKRYLKC